MRITITLFWFMFAPLLSAQENAKPAGAPPVLPNHEVKLTPPPLPAELTAGQTPTSQRSTNQELQARIRNGVLLIRIGDTWLPAAGSCCFCPDGAEKPLKWEPARQAEKPTRNR